jgi:RecA-family ATPase
MSAAHLKLETQRDAANDGAERPTSGELAQLAALSEQTKFMPPQAAITPLFAAEDFRAGRYLKAAPPLRRWLMKDVIPAGIVFQMIAPGGTGKTMAALQLSVSCATGLPFAGMWEVGEPGAVLMLLGEDDEDELHRRIWNITNHVTDEHPEALPLLSSNLYIKSVIGTDNLLTSNDSDTREVKHTALVDRLILTAQQIPNLKLIVIDPASRFRGGDENSAPDTTRFVQALERVAQATGAALLVIHHANKGSMSTAEASQNAARGSSALTDGVRLQINLATLNKEANKQYRLPEKEMRQYLTLAITKTNYSAPQGNILLKRGEGGYLSHVEEEGKLKEPSKLDMEILKKIRAAATQGKPHSKRSFSAEFAGVTGPYKMGQKALTDVLNRMIEAGHIRLDEKQRLT